MEAVLNPTPHVVSLPIDQIHDDGDDMRRTKISARADEALTSSLRRRGMLQPIGVRPNGNDYRIVFGRRRLRCARLAGFVEVPADIRDWQDAEIRAAQATENMLREPPHPIDVWLTVRDLVDAGYSIPEAAEELGLDDRRGRQMERLGRLAPELLELIEIEMPSDQHLRIIANAPLKAQKAAAKGRVLTRGPGDRELALWADIAARCKVERITQRFAIFDTAKHPGLWEEDLFASPDDPDRISTRHVADFMKLQHAALAAQVEQRRKNKERVQLAESNGSAGVTLPRGWVLVSIMPRKPKRTESLFVALRPDGLVAEVLAEDLAAKRKAEKAAKAGEKSKAQAAKPSPTKGDGAGEQDGGDDDELESGDEPAAAAPVAPGITKAGLTAIADAKTEALRQTLLTGLVDAPMERLVALLLLALRADNVHFTLKWQREPVDFEERERWRNFADVTDALLLPGGGLTEASTADLRMHVGAALARILSISGPDDANKFHSAASGPAAEWIGAAIGAESAIGRFDTAAFLTNVGGDELRRAAAAAGIKATGPVKALRERLVGALPDWRPAAAQFGAPGPSR